DRADIGVRHAAAFVVAAKYPVRGDARLVAPRAVLRRELHEAALDADEHAVVPSWKADDRIDAAVLELRVIWISIDEAEVRERESVVRDHVPRADPRDVEGRLAALQQHERGARPVRNARIAEARLLRAVRQKPRRP